MHGCRAVPVDALSKAPLPQRAKQRHGRKQYQRVAERLGRHQPARIVLEQRRIHADGVMSVHMKLPRQEQG